MEDRTIEIVELPFDDAAPCRGASHAPRALREAGLSKRLEKMGYRVYENRARVWNSEDNDQLNSVLSFAGLTCSRLAEVYAAKRFPLIIGGDHSVSIATISAAVKHCKSIRGADSRVGVLWVDAHPDLNTFKTSPSGNIHGMSMAALLGSGTDSLTDIDKCGQAKIQAESAAFMGLRCIDPGEQAMIDNLNLLAFTMDDVKRMGIEAVIHRSLEHLEKNCDAIVLSFDIDVCDPSIAPGVSTPEKGGLNFDAAKTLVTKIGQCKKLMAAEIVEYNPLNDIENMTAGLAIELAANLFGSR